MSAPWDTTPWPVDRPHVYAYVDADDNSASPILIYGYTYADGSSTSVMMRLSAAEATALAERILQAVRTIQSESVL